MNILLGTIAFFWITFFLLCCFKISRIFIKLFIHALIYTFIYPISLLSYRIFPPVFIRSIESFMCRFINNNSFMMNSFLDYWLISFLVDWVFHRFIHSVSICWFIYHTLANQAIYSFINSCSYNCAVFIHSFLCLFKFIVGFLFFQSLISSIYWLIIYSFEIYFAISSYFIKIFVNTFIHWPIHFLIHSFVRSINR